MKIVRRPDAMKNLCATYGKNGATIGFVPTMGALHDGHLSLIRMARQSCDMCVVSIFVNPIQFGPAEDFQKYPRPFGADCEKAKAAGCDAVFAPSQTDMYPADYATYVDVRRVTDTLCGAARPGHFQGVATIVLKLLNIVSPHVAVFGQKDAQQVVVIKRMATDLNLSTKIVCAPVVREPDGLAMSSRNVYLTAGERSQAPLIYKGLSAASEGFGAGERSARRLTETIESVFRHATLFSPEYIEIVDTTTLKPLETLTGPALMAIAVRSKESGTRLIDNIVLGGEL
ncbi:MAG: pantoate--beta-alanine ligase [Chitinivibrionales bacterium]